MTPGAIGRFLLAQRGRSLAGAFLAVAVLLLVQADQAPLLPLRHILFDSYQRMFPRDRTAQPAILVAIDEESLAKHGQWPWPRDEIAALLDKILAYGPRAVGFDILFPEPDRLGPAALAQRFPTLPAPALRALPDPDSILAAALAKGNTVLAVSGETVPSPVAQVPHHSLGLRGLEDEAHLPEFPASIGSLAKLEQAARGVGLINAPPDRSGTESERGVIRRVPMVARIGDTRVASLGLEIVRLGTNTRFLNVEADGHGIVRVGVRGQSLHTLPNGDLALHFGPLKSDRVVSAADVLAARIDPEILREKFVLVGFTGLGLLDNVVTPLGEKIPGVDVHLQVIESLLAGESLRRPWWMARVELAALILLGIGLILTVPVLRPAYAAGLGALVASLLAVGGFVAFRFGGWQFDSATVVTLLNPIFITLIGNTLVEADRRRREAEQELHTTREVSARVAGELDVARRIQMGLLPDADSLFANDPRIAVAALLEPARAVGGDYYECFAIDERHVCFAIGDVTGKGVPASLFMTIAKTLTGAMVRRVSNLGEALRQAEVELSRHNPEMLFVTTFVAVLDLDSGEIACVCAGHDAPILKRGRELLRLDLGSDSGPPVGACGNYPFVAARRQLEPGDLVCLFTDGVTEAQDGKRFYGGLRLLAAVARLPESADPRATVEGIRDDVRRFENGRPAADDLTLLALRWNGPAPR